MCVRVFVACVLIRRRRRPDCQLANYLNTLLIIYVYYVSGPLRWRGDGTLTYDVMVDEHGDVRVGSLVPHHGFGHPDAGAASESGSMRRRRSIDLGFQTGPVAGSVCSSSLNSANGKCGTLRCHRIVFSGGDVTNASHAGSSIDEDFDAGVAWLNEMLPSSSKGVSGSIARAGRGSRLPYPLKAEA